MKHIGSIVIRHGYIILCIDVLYPDEKYVKVYVGKTLYDEYAVDYAKQNGYYNITQCQDGQC